MISLLRHLLFSSILLASCVTAASLEQRNPYDLELERLRAQISSADALHQLALLGRIAGLRDYVDDRAGLAALLNEVAGRNSNEAVVRAEALACADGKTQHWYDDPERRAVILANLSTLPADAQGLQLRAELEYLAGAPEAAAHMRQAAELEPAAVRWLQAAEYTTEPLQKFAALQAGLALEPSNPRLNLDLAIYYIGRQQLEKAQALLRNGLAAAPDDFVLAIHLAELHMNLGLRSLAVRELHAVEILNPAPLWVQERLAIDDEQLGLLDEAVQLAMTALKENPADRQLLELVTRFHERRHLGTELEADYRKLLEIEPQSAELWSKLAGIESARGDLVSAKTALLHAAEFEPASADPHRRPASLYERFHLSQAAGTELAQSAALGHTGTNTSANDAGLFSNPRTQAALAFAHPLQADDVALSDIRVQELYDSGLNRVHVQQIFYAGSEAAVETHRLTSIRYSPGSEQVHVLHARIWKPGGQVIDAQESGEGPVAETSVAMYYDMRSRQLRFAGLEKGDVVELDYTVSPTLRQSPYPGYFGELVTLAGRTPARLRRYVLIAPANQKIFVHGEKVAAARESEDAGRRTMVWEVHDVAALTREPRSPGITETAPYVHVSTMADWQHLGAWYAELIRPQFALDQALQNELSRLLQGKDSDQEKIAAIHEFVLRNTHYVALEFGIYSYKPYPVAQTYARRFGDCKDKASLMIALLKAAGIEAQIALVRTRSLGQVSPSPASIALFDHAIVYIPAYDVWLDGTAEYSGRELPMEDQGALALTVSLSGQAELRRIPVSSARDNYTKRTIYAELTAEGAIRFSGSTLTRGEDAPGLRRDLAVREQQLDSFRQRLAEVFPTIEVDDIAVHGAHDLESDVSVDFQGALNSFEHKPVARLSSSWMPRNYLSALAPSSTRTQDLVLASPWTTEEEIHIALPKDAAVKSLPHDREVSSGFGSLTLRYSESSGEIIIQSHVEFDRTRIKADEYAEFRQFCSAVERSFHNEVVVGLSR